MTSTDTGFHAGELAVQRKAGVQQDAARLSRMLEPVELSGGIVKFLAERTFLVITGRDETGRLWTSPLVGPRGFLDVESTTRLAVHAAPPAGDPLCGIAAGQQIGMTSVEFAARRRVRLNGTLVEATDGLLVVDVEQAFGNCPQYIPQRLLSPDRSEPSGDVRRGSALEAQDVDLIESADSFFLGTVHPGRGADASHRGGPVGFVRIDGQGVWWPDYQGNNLFNSLGNIEVNPETALLFFEFTTGRTLQLSGTANIEWGDDADRSIRFSLERLVAGHLLGAQRERSHR
ncbi:pyridoxamine 5'-phosphate oxidase family protein [Kribbella sp. NPDC003557]|uniref:pyridoxamine 5'-phosphate oxidase family protein n=1 Tax=Kribbella sp. NPDC003557 TaxID=3154449 RepID=UPI0033BF7EDC